MFGNVNSEYGEKIGSEKISLSAEYIFW
jgi:hypothetical protein